MPTIITFQTNERTDKAIEYIMQKLGVNGKTRSDRWRKLLVNTHKYLVKAESEKANHQTPENINTDESKTPKCYYLAITEKGVWYCETKKIEEAVCIQQHKRYIAMKLRCRPMQRKKTRTRTTPEKPPRTMVKATFVQCPESTKKTSLKYCIASYLLL